MKRQARMTAAIGIAALLCVAIAVSRAHAADAVAIPANGPARLGVIEGGSIGARKVLVGPDNTTVLMAQTGVGTNSTVVTFNPAFTATPRIWLSYAASPGPVSTNTPLYAASVSTNGFTLVGKSAISINWLAVGAK